VLAHLHWWFLIFQAADLAAVEALKNLISPPDLLGK
jgi:hypothetical protein